MKFTGPYDQDCRIRPMQIHGKPQQKRVMNMQMNSEYKAEVFLYAVE